MWDVFTITLVNGTVLTYTNRDPDSPEPSAAASGLGLLDTFGGGGNMSTHVGEIGANWSAWASEYADLEGDPGRLNRFLLDGGSMAPASTNEDLGRLKTTFAPEGNTSAYYMFANFSIGNGGDFSIGSGNFDTGTQAFVDAYIDTEANVGNRVFMFMTLYGATESASSDQISTGIAPGANLTMKMEIFENRTSGRFLVNGAEAGNVSLPSENLGIQAYTYINLNAFSANTPTPIVNELSGGTL